MVAAIALLVIMLCIGILAVAMEMSAPILVAVGALGATPSGIVRLVGFSPVSNEPPRIPLMGKKRC